MIYESNKSNTWTIPECNPAEQLIVFNAPRVGWTSGVDESGEQVGWPSCVDESGGRVGEVTNLDSLPFLGPFTQYSGEMTQIQTE